MAWTFIFALSAGVQGALLAAADIFASSNWLYWAITLNTALSQYAIAMMAVRLYKRRNNHERRTEEAA